MNELKPEDVMRALECCQSVTPLDCRECPYKDQTTPEYKSCCNLLVADALALLREKDAKIAELQSIAEFQQSSNMKRWFELQEKDKQLDEKDAEIERLTKRLDREAKCQYELATKIVDLKEKVELTRSETITEFAERLKKFYANLKGKTVGGSVEYHIDQIAKEMRVKL